MLKRTFCLCKTYNITRIAKEKLSSVASPEKWDLFAAVCVERKPVVTPKLNELEESYLKVLSQIEFERSLKSDHEMRHEKEQKQLELLKKGETDLDLDVNLKNTAQDFADASLDELLKFKPASIVTEDDKSNNQKTTNRKLDKHLVLLVKQKLGEKNYFILPQTMRQDGETLRQTADRILKESCGDDLKAQIYSNAPVGFYKYKYPKKVQETTGNFGAKVFFYFARYNSGFVKNEDFKWLDREELEKSLPKDYKNSVKQFLLDE